MKAWAENLDADKSSGIHFLADPAGDFTRALDMEFDSTKIMGNKRSKRYAIVTEDGKIKSAHPEPENTPTTGESQRQTSVVLCLVC